MRPKSLTTHILLVTAILCFSTITTHARDISNEQRNAYEARETLNKKRSSHQNLVKRISQQEKRVQEEQARLNKLKADEQAAKVALDQAKVDLDNKVNALNAVWDSRNK